MMNDRLIALRLWFGSKVCYDDRLRLIDDPMKPQSTFNIVSIGMVFIAALIGCGQKGGYILMKMPLPIPIF